MLVPRDLIDKVHRNLSGISQDLLEIKIDVAITKENVKWLRKRSWLFMVIMLGTLIVTIMIFIKS